MKCKLCGITAAMLLAVAMTTASAQENNVTGYNKVEVPAGTDVIVSASFQEAKDTFAVTSVTGTGVQISGGITTDEYATLYYVRFLDGNAEGRWSTITSNTTNEFVFSDTSFLSDVAVGDTFEVYRHRTLGVVFPDSLKEHAFKESSSTLNRSTEILIPNTTAVGTNKSPATTYYYKDGAWRKFPGNPSASYNDAILGPDVYFIIRNNSDEELVYVCTGQVPMLTQTLALPTETSQNDLAVVSGRPYAMTLDQLGLGGTAAFETSTSPLARKDELLVFDNTTIGTNKSPEVTYYYYNGAWREYPGSPAKNCNDETIDPGAALIIRKASGTTGEVEWSQNSPY